MRRPEPSTVEGHRTMAKAIDTGETDSKAVVRNWVLPLKYASATEVANTIKEAYREYVNNDPVAGRVGGFRGFGFGVGRGFGELLEEAEVAPGELVEDLLGGFAVGEGVAGEALDGGL